jgi:hypothetical protein
MISAFLGATGRHPAAELLLAPDGERFPFPLPGDDMAFDHALPRVGWVAVQFDRQVIALMDGDWWRPLDLGLSWKVAPAAHAAHLIVKRDTPDMPEGTVALQVIDSSGGVLRAAQSSWTGVAGELQDGTFVCSEGLLAPGAQARPLPWEGEPIAVLDGRYVLAVEKDSPGDAGRLAQHDAIDGGVQRCELPGQSFLLSPLFDPKASSVALVQWNAPWVIVSDVALGPRVVDVGFPQHSAAWIDQQQLLLVGHRRQVVLDVRAGNTSTFDGLPRGGHPRIHVTGRFNFDDLKAAQSPRFSEPISRNTRDKLLEVELARLVEVVGLTGLPTDVVERAVPAVRLRSCLAPSRIALGVSRFGGRPDLPRGHRWPQHGEVPMAFLAQLRCDELVAALPDSDIPSSGMLVVFVAVAVAVAVDEDEGAIYGDAVHIEHVPTERLSRRAWPANLPEEARFMPSLASVEPMLSPPNRWELSDALTPAQADALQDFATAGGSLHQVLGHPLTVQDVALAPEERQLLRLDSDPLNGTLYGDGGSLWVTIQIDRPLADALALADLMMDST